MGYGVRGLGCSWLPVKSPEKLATLVGTGKISTTCNIYTRTIRGYIRVLRDPFSIAFQCMKKPQPAMLAFSVSDRSWVSEDTFTTLAFKDSGFQGFRVEGRRGVSALQTGLRLLRPSIFKLFSRNSSPKPETLSTLNPYGSRVLGLGFRVDS